MEEGFCGGGADVIARSPKERAAARFSQGSAAFCFEIYSFNRGGEEGGGRGCWTHAHAHAEAQGHTNTLIKDIRFKQTQHGAGGDGQLFFGPAWISETVAICAALTEGRKVGAERGDGGGGSGGVE